MTIIEQQRRAALIGQTPGKLVHHGRLCWRGFQDCTVLCAAPFLRHSGIHRAATGSEDKRIVLQGNFAFAPAVRRLRHLANGQRIQKFVADKQQGIIGRQGGEIIMPPHIRHRLLLHFAQCRGPFDEVHRRLQPVTLHRP